MPIPGVYARMAKNRIARLGAPNAVLPGVNGTADFSCEALKAEIGTQETEKSLPLTQYKRREVQQRLLALAFEPGKISGVFNVKTRSAIADWQKGHQLSATGWLAPLQYSALLAESETPLRRFLAEKSAPPPSRPAKINHRTLTSARSMVTVNHRAAAHAHVARRTLHSHATHQGQDQGFDPSGAAFIGGLVGGAAAGLLSHGF